MRLSSYSNNSSDDWRIPHVRGQKGQAALSLESVVLEWGVARLDGDTVLQLTHRLAARGQVVRRGARSD